MSAENYTQIVKPVAGVEAKRAKIDASSGANTLVAAVSGKRVCVLAIVAMAADPVSATLYSGPTDTGAPISGPMPLAANGGFVVPAPNDPSLHWFETNAGEPLTLALDVPVQVSGWLVYYEG